MEDKKNQTQQLILNYGLILGFLSIVHQIIRYAMGKYLEQDWTAALTGFILMFAVIGYAIYLYKQINEGYLTIGEGIKLGVGIALIAGIIGVIYTFIFTTYVVPDFTDQMIAFQHQQILERYPQISDEQIDAATNMTKKMTSPGMMAAFGLIGSMFFGLIVSLILSLFMKKSKENPYNN